jgi:hypothetical protein
MMMTSAEFLGSAFDPCTVASYHSFVASKTTRLVASAAAALMASSMMMRCPCSPSAVEPGAVARRVPPLSFE